MTSVAPPPPLTPQAIDDARSLIGIDLRRRQHNTEVRRPSVFRWAKAIGDHNPLWLSDSAAESSVHGSIVAPPCWLLSVDDGIVAPKLSRCHVLLAGIELEFDRWLRVGDRIRTSARLVDVSEKTGSFCGPMVMQTGVVEYTDTTGRRVATARAKVMRTPREAAVTVGKYANVRRHRYELEELHEIEAGYDAEEIRGRLPRYWEDAAVGETLTPLVRGPLTSEDMLQFVCATRPQLGFGAFHEHLRRHPDAGVQDPFTGAWEVWDTSMVSDPIAQLFGFPLAHDAGLDRVSWLGNLLTNWMGDSGFLERLSVDLVRPNFYGDATWCRGEVVRKSDSDGAGRVTVELRCTNQRAETTATGEAVVVLPERSAVSAGQRVEDS